MYSACCGFASVILRESPKFAPEMRRSGYSENVDRVNYSAPVVKEPVTAHFILKIADKGTPQLSRYQRIIVTITP